MVFTRRTQGNLITEKRKLCARIVFRKQRKRNSCNAFVKIILMYIQFIVREKMYTLYSDMFKTFSILRCITSLNYFLIFVTFIKVNDSSSRR